MSYARYRTRTIGSTDPVLLGTSGTIQFPYCVYKETDNFSGIRLPSLQEQCWDFVNPGPPYKEGHAFFLKRLTANYIDSDDIEAAHYFYKYAGRFTISGVSASSEAVAAHGGYGETAQSYGAQAFAKARPAQPSSNSGQCLFELRDFPSLWRVALRRFKDLGNLYLNVEFGWRPFLRDLADVLSTARSIDRKIANIRKNNGKWKKRNITLRNATTITEVPWNHVTPVPPAYLMWPTASSPKGTKTLIVKDRIWFEAMMKYYIPDLHLDDGLTIGSSRLIRRLYGLDITPSLLWEILPWTWLQNWAFRVKDLLINLESQNYDNLVTKYAYVMRHRETSVVIQSSVATQMGPPICVDGRFVGHQDSYAGPVALARAVFTAECKERSQVCQWNVGNLDSPLSDSQLAILLALGIQRFG